MNFDVLSVRKLYPRLEISCNGEWKALNCAFSYDVISHGNSDHHIPECSNNNKVQEESKLCFNSVLGCSRRGGIEYLNTSM